MARNSMVSTMEMHLRVGLFILQLYKVLSYRKLMVSPMGIFVLRVYWLPALIHMVNWW